MKKIITAVILAAAVASPAFASDGSEAVMQSQGQSGYTSMSDGAGTFAFAPRANWQSTNNGQWQNQSPIIDR